MNNSKLNVVLYRVGGQRPVTITHDKCLIRTVHDNQQVDCCAIYNGTNGTALRTYCNSVLVNGEPTAARWLSAGDQIQLPCATLIEVREATLLRPIFSDRKRTVAEVDQKLTAIGAGSKVASTELATGTKPATEPAETFHSPFSADLPEVDRENAKPKSANASIPVNTTSSQPKAETGDASDELESIFARMGVANVGSIAHPESSSSVANKVDEAPTQVDETIDEKQDSELEAVANVRQELEAHFADTPSPDDAATPEAEPTTLPPSTPVEKASVDSIAVSPAVESPTSIPKVTIPTTPSSLPNLSSPAVTQQPAVSAPVAPTPAVKAPTTTEDPPFVEENTASDPLAELPDDLRNQLNDLVSSLEKDVPVAPSVQPANAVIDTATTPTPTPESATIPEGAAAKIEVPQADEPLAAMETKAVEKPVEDESISTMFEDAMRAIQGDAEAVSEPAAITNSVEDLSVPATVSQPTVPEQQTASPVQQPAAKPQSVADVLGAMGMEVPGANEMDPSPSPESAPTPPPAIAPEPVAEQPNSIPQNVPATPVFANMQNASEATPNPATPAAVGNAEDDIQAYMNRLLNRTTSETESNLAAAPPTQPVVEERESQEVLSPEEFVPSHKPTRPENYDTLREIANTSSRTAVRQSSRRAEAQSILFKIFCFLTVLLGAGVALFLGKTLIAGMLVFVAIASAFVFLKANKGLPQLPPKEQPKAQ